MNGSNAGGDATQAAGSSSQANVAADAAPLADASAGSAHPAAENGGPGTSAAQQAVANGHLQSAETATPPAEEILLIPADAGEWLFSSHRTQKS